MLAAVAIAPGQGLELVEILPVKLGPFDVLIDIEAAGVCHSDLKPIDPRTPAQNWPFVAGHEGVGRVAEVGAQVTMVRRGDRVLTSFASPCQRCYWCERGQQALCQVNATPRPKARTAAGVDVFGHAGLGVFAEQAIVHETSVVPVSTDLPSDRLALLSCGFTTGVCAALNSPGLAAGGSAVVFGLGGVGQAVVQGAALAGAAVVIGVDPIGFKRDLARRLGATHVLDPETEDVVEAVRALTNARGSDVAFDVVGHPDVATQAFYATRRGGRLVLVGAANGSIGKWTLHEQMTSSREVVGSLYGGAYPQRDFPQLISLVEAGRLDLDSLVSEVVPLKAVNDTLRALQAGEVLRAVLSIGQTASASRTSAGNISVSSLDKQ